MISPIESLALSVKPGVSVLSAPAPVDQIRPAPRAQDGFDAERFSRLMEAQPVHKPSATDTCAPGVGAADCLGDKMLARISSMGDDFNKTWSEVAEVVAGPENSMSLQDMLKAQLHLVRVAAEYETIGKAIGKSTQNVDQMLRMQ